MKTIVEDVAPLVYLDVILQANDLDTIQDGEIVFGEAVFRKKKFKISVFLQGFKAIEEGKSYGKRQEK